MQSPESVGWQNGRHHLCQLPGHGRAPAAKTSHTFKLWTKPTSSRCSYRWPLQLRDEAWAALERTKPQLPEMFQGREKELLETVCMGLPAEKVDGFTKLFKSMSKPAMEQFMASPQAQAEEANSQQAQAAARSGSGPA